MLKITLPQHSKPEAKYITNIIFGEFLGVEYNIVEGKADKFLIEDGGRKIIVNAPFFNFLANGDEKPLIDKECKSWDSEQVAWDITLIDSLVPVLFGEPNIEQKDKEINIDIDIFGAAFFMLSRYEETHTSKLDKHNRFPVEQAMAYKNGFLLRPIIDEYVEILWSAMQQLWPQIKRKKRQYEIVPTHDVDTPYLANTLSASHLIRRAGGDIFYRKNPLLAAKTVASFIQYKLSGNIPSYDVYNIYDWFMDLSEQGGVKSRFYFMTDLEPDNFYGGRYDIENAHVMALMKKIADHGHEIGIHPTAESYNKEGIIAAQAKRLRQAMANNNIKQDYLGGRQHYLRWQTDKTPSLWAEAELDYDSTLSHAEHVGFRCGTCHSFALWDFKEQKELKTKEHPLILMECSLVGKNYMDYNFDQAIKTIGQLKQAVKTVNGRFIFLWHNSALLSTEDRRLYEACMSA